VADGAGRRGEALWDLLDAAVRARGIEVRYQATAERLVLSPGGSVTGLATRHAGEPVIHEAVGGVILACGGFEADPVLADAYLPLGPSWPVGHLGNTGAGLVMAQQAGAAPSAADLLPYVTSKGALVALARTLAVAHGADGIAVTCVAPGLTATPAAQAGMPAAAFEAVRARQALPRTLRPGDVAATVAFLASDGAAALTGQTLCTDGGLVMR
jgi:NAD(P)-dependent dehydrogenase (short-subunit alcohol dehydrogenase family)